MISYSIRISKITSDEIDYFGQQAGIKTVIDGEDICLVPPPVQVLITQSDAMLGQSPLVHSLQNFLRRFRPDEVIGFIWTCTWAEKESLAEGLVVSSDGISTLNLRNITAQRYDQVRRIYEPKHNEEYQRFVRAIGRIKKCPVTMLLVRDSVTPRKVRVAMVDPYELYSITKKIWCGDDSAIFEPLTPDQEWDRNEEPGMSVVAIVNPSMVVDHDSHRFIELLKSYDSSKNPRSHYQDNEFVRSCMANRLFGRPFMLGPTGIFPRNAVVL